jgi:ribosomal protein L25, Ctc-form
MDIILAAQAREKKEKLSPDFVPAVLYGRGVASSSLKVNRSELDKAVHQAGESNLITLKHDGGEVKVIIKEAQRSGMTGKLLNVDFFQVNMADKITTEIPLHFVGESKAVKELSGSLIKDIDSLEVECLPDALVDHIDVDISILNNYHDEISVKDLILPAGMKLTHDVNRVIVSVIPPRVQEAVVEAAPATTKQPEAKEEPKNEK